MRYSIIIISHAYRARGAAYTYMHTYIYTIHLVHPYVIRIQSTAYPTYLQTLRTYLYVSTGGARISPLNSHPLSNFFKASLPTIGT